MFGRISLSWQDHLLIQSIFEILSKRMISDHIRGMSFFDSPKGNIFDSEKPTLLVSASERFTRNNNNQKLNECIFHVYFRFILIYLMRLTQYSHYWFIFPKLSLGWIWRGVQISSLEEGGMWIQDLRLTSPQRHE